MKHYVRAKEEAKRRAIEGVSLGRIIGEGYTPNRLHASTRVCNKWRLKLATMGVSARKGAIPKNGHAATFAECCEFSTCGIG